MYNFKFISAREGEELVLFLQTLCTKMMGVRIFLHLVFIVALVLVHSNVFTQDTQDLAFECPKCKELVEIGIDYEGYGIRVVIEKNWSKCKEKCTEEPTCKVWTYIKSNKKCFLKTSDKGRTKKQSVKSGTRACKTEFIFATADFSQNNLCGFKVPDLKGHRLQNGDFIFSWRNKMVLTDNQGCVKKWGMVEYGTMSWQDPSTWITYDSRQYTVSNFILFKQSCPRPRCTDIIHFGVRYPGNDIEEFEGIPSFTKCKDLCTRHVEYNAWTFTISKKECKLKSEKGNTVKDGDKVSGTRVCFD